MPGFGAEVTPISQLTTKAALLERLSLLATEEAQLDAHLTSLISSRSKLEYQLTRLEGWKSAVGGIEREASEMCREVGEVALTAERVGGKVRVLDEEQVSFMRRSRLAWSRHENRDSPDISDMHSQGSKRR
jgi:hypothetical protein